jgi:TRAP-type C4-dicarboxylate transport system substrate-binding protein
MTYRRTLGLVGALALAAGPAAAEAWDMPTPYPEGNFHTQNILQFAEDVKAATNGDLEITVHSSGALIKHPEIKNAVRSGQVPIGEFLLSRLSNEDAIFEVDAVPFLADSYEDAARLWDVSRPVVEEKLAQQDLTVLFSVPWPPQGLYAGQPIETLDDMAGLRFRTYNAATERFAQLAGAVPTQVEVPDIPQAFATGRVGAMITSAATGVDSKAWDFLSHYYDTQAFLPKNVVVVNTSMLEGLSEETRAALLEAAAAAEERGWQASEAETKRTTEELAANGIQVAPPSDALAGSLTEIGQTMAEEWSEQAGPEGKALLETFGG